MSQGESSPEWQFWKAVEEKGMTGLIEKQVFEQVEHPQGKLVMRAKLLYKRKSNANGEILKCKCRFVTQDFW